VKSAYEISVGKCGRKRMFRTPRRGWEDNIKMDLTEIACGLD